MEIFNVTWDEVLADVTSLLVIYAILQMAGRHGGVRQALRLLTRAIITRDMQAWQMILLGLLIPKGMQLVYYALLMLNLPWFQDDIVLRQNIVRAYTVFGDLILFIYFMNGTLVQWVDAVMQQVNRLWKMQFHI